MVLEIVKLISVSGLLFWIYKVIHSIYLSPLRTIPTPWLVHCVPFYYEMLLALGIAPFKIHEWHLKLGPALRVGWHKVLFVDGKAGPIIYGTYALKKSPFYKGFSYFGETIISTSDRQLHSQRKKMIAPAFTKSMLVGIEQHVINTGLQPLFDNLDYHIKIKTNEPINIFNEIRFMMWDIIGVLAMGQSFNMIKGEHRALVKWISSLLRYGIVCVLFPIAKYFKPACLRNVAQLQENLFESYFARREHKDPNDPPTIIDRYVDFVDPVSGKPLNYQELFGEAHLLLLSGTDTTSSTLTTLLYCLISNPHALKQVQHEIDQLETDSILQYKDLHSLTYLQAAIKETLRILPVASIPLSRVVPEGGRTICGYFIPEGTEVAVPLYSLHRSPLIWDKPTEFLPERWLPTEPSQSMDSTTNGPPLRPEITPTSKPYMPFITGPRGCLGKDLAYMELSVLMANLLRRYEFSLTSPDPIEFIASPALGPKGSCLNVNLKHRSN